MSNKLWLLFLLFVSQPLLADTEEYESKFKCSVTNVAVIMNEDGKSHKFNSIHNIKTGSDVIIELSLDNIFYSLTLSHLKDSQIIGFGLVTLNDNHLSEELKNLTLKDEVIKIEDFGGFATLRKNHISLQAQNHNFSLSRYYKNDWQGLFSLMTETWVETYSVNCLDTNFEYSEIRAFAESMKNK